MDSKDKERMEKFKKYETQYANYLKGTYFSNKDIYGDKIFKEKATIHGEVIKTSRDAATKSFTNSLAYLKEKFVRSKALRKGMRNLSIGKQTQTQSFKKSV